MLSNYVIYCEEFRKILQQTEKVALKKEQKKRELRNSIKYAYFVIDLDSDMANKSPYIL